MARLGTRVNYMARLPRQTAAVVEKIEEEKGTLGRTMQTLADLVSGSDVVSDEEDQRALTSCPAKYLPAHFSPL